MSALFTAFYTIDGLGVIVTYTYSILPTIIFQSLQPELNNRKNDFFNRAAYQFSFVAEPPERKCEIKEKPSNQNDCYESQNLNNGTSSTTF